MSKKLNDIDILEKAINKMIALDVEKIKYSSIAWGELASIVRSNSTNNFIDNIAYLMKQGRINEIPLQIDRFKDKSNIENLTGEL